MPEHTITFLPNPTQKEFIESRSEADLFSCRMGEGKSAALCWSCFYFMQWNPGTDFLFIRDTWENMQRTTLKEFFNWFPPGVLGVWNEKKKLFKWTAERIGLKGDVSFLGLDDKRDAGKLQSMPLDGFAMDEVAPAVAESAETGISEEIFDLALGRRRSKNANWVAGKLATNNPDERHWSYRRFVDPGEEGFQVWQTREPENVVNLQEGYYEKLRRRWSHRPGWVRRFIDGKYGFQQIGKAVTPQWSDDLHLAEGLKPYARVPLHFLWDGGHHPCWIVTQIAPSGNWNILECIVGDGIGVFELVEDHVKPAIADRYRNYAWTHIGDDSMRTADQTSIKNSPVRMIRRELGGRWKSGPISMEARVEPLQVILKKISSHRGLVQVDRDRAKEVWHALRGGWHRHVTKGGVVGDVNKDAHSHPGDAMGYGAAVLYPLGRLKKRTAVEKPSIASFFNGGSRSGSLGFERPGVKLPKHGKVLA